MLMKLSFFFFFFGIDFCTQSYNETWVCGRLTRREKCPYSDFFWPVFSRIWIEYGPEKSGYGHFSRSVRNALEPCQTFAMEVF